MRRVSRFFLVLCAVMAAASAWSKDATAPAAQATSSSSCSGKPLISYTLGPKKDIDALYPTISTASQSAADQASAVAASIQLYLQTSLHRDQFYDVCGLNVKALGPKGYQVSFYSAKADAPMYSTAQPAWLKRGALALQGIKACQGSKTCWEPSDANLTCAGPWQFYLPLGLPMLAQKMVMLLHYPPYTALQQSDYLNNATLNRWQRLLGSVGVASNDTTLYTTTVDIFPIAAPGSGETGCFPTANAMNFFGPKGSKYIPTMLQALVIPAATTASPTNGTKPVIVFGSEAIGYWNAAYPATPTAVLKAGRAQLIAGDQRTTAFIGANHPIAAVYQSCGGTPGIVEMVAQDLATACFAKAMGDKPDADPVATAAACQQSYEKAAPTSPEAAQVCINAVIDKSPQYNNWTQAQAAAWCTNNNNQVCPLPDYNGK